MATVPLIATRSHRYDGRRLVPGEPFLARSREDAQVLRALGVARTAPAPAPSPPSSEEAQTDEAPSGARPSARRRYQRRDLVPDE